MLYNAVPLEVFSVQLNVSIAMAQKIERLSSKSGILSTSDSLVVKPA